MEAEKAEGQRYTALGGQNLICCGFGDQADSFNSLPRSKEENVWDLLLSFGFFYFFLRV